MEYLESYAGVDLNSDTGKYTLQKFLQSNGADLSTAEIDSIVGNLDKIKSGEYAGALGSTEGSEFIDGQLQNFNDSKLQDMLQYNAESLNAQERIGDSVNEATSVLKDLYNDLPQWIQNTISGAGGALNGIGTTALTLGSGWLGEKAIGKAKGFFGKINTKRQDRFTSYADDIVDAYNGGGNVDDLLKGLSKNWIFSDLTAESKSIYSTSLISAIIFSNFSVVSTGASRPSSTNNLIPL
jgi:hypothetical protein